MLGKPEQFAPGAKKVYTNANTNLLGAVVEKATGRPYADVLERAHPRAPRTERTPATSSTPAPGPNLTRSGTRRARAVRQVQPDNLSIFGPAGSMITTIEDGRVWGEILATGALLKPETQAERQAGGTAGCRSAVRPLRPRHGPDRRLVGAQR